MQLEAGEEPVKAGEEGQQEDDQDLSGEARRHQPLDQEGDEDIEGDIRACGKYRSVKSAETDPACFRAGKSLIDQQQAGTAQKQP